MSGSIHKSLESVAFIMKDLFDTVAGEFSMDFVKLAFLFTRDPDTFAAVPPDGLKIR